MTHWTPCGAGLLLLMLVGGALQAAHREIATVEAAAATIEELSAIPLKGIPAGLIQDAKGVAIFPNVVKASLVIGGRFGRGVVLVRQPDGTWSNPVFVTLTGGSVGWQIGVQSTDLVLVFKTSHSLDRILKGKGKITLGADVAIAAGPVGRQAEAATDAQLRAEIFSYARSRGLFLGLSLEGAGVLVDGEANEALYGVHAGRPEEDWMRRTRAIPAIEALKAQLIKLSMPPRQPVIILPPPPPPY
jgi:lipid-binding SYLF domain-containing protein